MHPVIPPHSQPPISNLSRSLEHPLPHDLRFESPATTPASEGTLSVPQIVNAYPGDTFSPSLHPQFVSGTRVAARPTHISNAAPCLLSDLPPAFGPQNPDIGLVASATRVGSPRSCGTSGSSFSTRGLSTASSRLSGSHDSSSGSDRGVERRAKPGRRRVHRSDCVDQKPEAPEPGNMAYPQAHPGVAPDPRLMLCGPGMTTMTRGLGLDGFHHPGNPARGSFPPGSPQLYGYPSPLLSHQPPSLPGDLGHPQFGGMLSSIAGLADPTGFGGAVAMFSGPRGGVRPGFHTAGGRFMVEGSAPHLVDESLPTYPNAAAAPNRLPAHKPVRLTQPKHPLAPPGTPVYFKYGEEHYPEETVPPEYTFTETDGTICRYITNFLVYNKRGERLLPIEVLDQPRHAALVLYGSLLPAAAMSQTALRSGKREDDDGRGKKRSASGSTNGLAKRQMGASGAAIVREGGRKRNEVDRWVAERGGAMGGVTQTYPVRVELAEWCIDYGQEPSNVPFIWLISRWDVYYRLEKPAGRYIPTFATAKMKFEVSTRVIKTLQYRPDTEYRVLVGLLTAATRHERSLKKIERRAQLKRERQQQQQQQQQQQFVQRGMKQESDDEDDIHETQKIRLYDNVVATDGIKLEDGFDVKCDMPSTGLTKKKNRNWRIQSLSTPQGTGVVITDEEGRPQASTPWGAPYAVDGFKESMLLGLAEFLESQLRNFMEGVGGAGDTGCPNLLTVPFMRTLRERTALRMETLQLMDAKKRALELARSLAEAASGHAMSQALNLDGSMVGGGASGDATDYLAFQQQCHANAAGGYNVRPPPTGYFSSESGVPPTGPYYPPNGLSLLGPQAMLAGTPSGSIAADGIQALESEIRHLQQLLRDSEDDSDGPDDPGGLHGDSDGSSSELDRRSHVSRLGGTHRQSKLGGFHDGTQGMYADVGFRLSPDGEINSHLLNEIGAKNGELLEPRCGPRCLVRSRADDETIPFHGEFRSRDLSSSDFSSEEQQPNEDRGSLCEAYPHIHQPVISMIRRGEAVQQNSSICVINEEDVIRQLPTDERQDQNREGAVGEFACLSGGCPEEIEAKMTSNEEATKLESDPSSEGLHEYVGDASSVQGAKVEQSGKPKQETIPSDEQMRLTGVGQSPAPEMSSSPAGGGLQFYTGHRGGSTDVGDPSNEHHGMGVHSTMSIQQGDLSIPGGIGQIPIPQSGIVQAPMGQPPMAPHLFAAFGFPFLQGFPPPTDPSAFAGNPLFPFGGLAASMGHPFLPFPPAYLTAPPSRHPSKRHGHRADDGQRPTGRARSAEPDSGSKKRKGSLFFEGTGRAVHGTSTALDAMTPSKRAKTAKSPKAKSTIPNVHITMPAFPRDVADDLDIPVSDLRYYRAHLPLDRLKPFQRIRLVEVWDFLSTMSGWLGWPDFAKLGFGAIEGALGFKEENPSCPSEVLMAVLLRLYCRRFEKLRNSEVGSVATSALHEFELAATNDANGPQMDGATLCGFESSGDSEKCFSTTTITKVDDSDGLSNIFPDAYFTALTAQALPYRSWFPSSVISKQPAQLLTSRGWVNAVSSYAPLEVLLVQPTVQILQRLAENITAASDPKEYIHTEFQPGSDGTSVLDSLFRFLDQALELWSRKPSGATSGDKAPMTTILEPDVEHSSQTDSILANQSVDVQVSPQNATREVVQLCPGPASLRQLTIKAMLRRSEILRNPRLADLSFGLASGIQWWRDEGSIDEVTWELYCRLALWDALCDVPVEMTRRRGGGGNGEGENQRPSKRRKVRPVAGDNGKTDSPVPSTCYEEGVDVNCELRQDGETDGPPASLPGEEGVIDEEGVGATSDAGSVDETVDPSDGGSSRSLWTMDERKAFNNGVAPPCLRRMEKILYQMNGIRTTSGIGWYRGLIHEDRSLLLSWMITQIARSTLGRDMVERQADVFATVKALIVSYDRPTPMQLKVPKTQKSPGARKGKPKKSPRSAKALSASTETGGAVTVVSPAPDLSGVATFTNACALTGTSSTGLDSAGPLSLSGPVCAPPDDVHTVASPSDAPVSASAIHAATNATDDAGEAPANDDPAGPSQPTAAGGAKPDGEPLDGDNVDQGMDAIANDPTMHCPNAPEGSNANGVGQDVRESEASSNAANKDVPAATVKRPRQYSRRTPTKSELVNLLETASIKFRIRRVVLGEDRYFNRYFLFSTPKGKSQLFIEYHVLVPATDNASRMTCVDVVRKRLPAGVAAETDINQEDAGATESPSALLSAATSAAARLKRLTARGRPRKARTAGGAGEVQSEEQDALEGDDWVAGGKGDDVAAPKGSGTTVRRSGRTTKGQRKEPLYLDEFSSEEGDILIKQEDFEEKKVKGKPVVSASFLSSLIRKMDGALFWRRPLGSQLKLKFLPDEAISDADEKLKGSLVMEYDSEQIEEVVVYEGCYRSISRRRHSRPLADTFEHAKIGDTSPNCHPITSDDGARDVGQKESEGGLILSRMRYFPALQWGLFRDPEEIRQLATSLSSFTTRERGLKAELLRLLDLGVFGRVEETTTPTSSVEALPVQQANVSWRRDVLRKLALLLAKVTGFNRNVVALTIGSYKQPDVRRLRDASNQLERFALSIATLPDDEFVVGLLILLRSTLLCILMMARLLRSVPAVARVVTPVPASGWNGRSSPVQWDNELKAFDWFLATLAASHFSGANCEGRPASIVESIFIMTLPDQGSFSKHPIDGSCYSVVSSILCDLISFLGLYFSLWIRFGLNRPVIEYLLASTELFLDGLPRPGSEIVLTKSIYLQWVQELKASGALVVDECLPSNLESKEALRVLQVWLERLNGREPSKEAGILQFKERPGFAHEDEEVLLRMRCCLTADWEAHGDDADDFFVVVPAEGFASRGICLQCS